MPIMPNGLLITAAGLQILRQQVELRYSRELALTHQFGICRSAAMLRCWIDDLRHC